MVERELSVCYIVTGHSLLNVVSFMTHLYNFFSNLNTQNTSQKIVVFIDRIRMYVCVKV